jgi:hypothetical protein
VVDLRNWSRRSYRRSAARSGGAPWAATGGRRGAGLRHEAASENNETQLAPAAADPRFPPEYQSAYEVRGTSTDRLARPGDFLIVLDRKAAGLPLRSGDIVIVAQMKNGLRETTARRFRTKMNVPGCELTFESNDPKYNVGIWLPNQESTESLSLMGYCGWRVSTVLTTKLATTLASARPRFA